MNSDATEEPGLGGAPPDPAHDGQADSQAARHGHVDADSADHGHAPSAGHGVDSLGRPDFAMWGAGVLGVLVALLVAACFAIAVSGIQPV